MPSCTGGARAVPRPAAGRCAIIAAVPTNARAAEITDRYRAQALDLRRLTIAAAQSAYELAMIPRRGDGLGDLDARWARFTRTAAAAATGQQRAHAALSDSYLRSYIAASDPEHRDTRPALPVAEHAGIMDDGRPLVQGLASGLVIVRLALARAEPPERALLAGWHAAGRLLGHAVLQAGRSALSAAMSAEERVIGWERVTGADACGACLALADGIYPDADSMDVHDNCSCTAEPVLDGVEQEEPRPTGEELFDSLSEREQAARFAGRGGEAKAALVRADESGRRPVPFSRLADRQGQASRAAIVIERPAAELAKAAEHEPYWKLTRAEQLDRLGVYCSETSGDAVPGGYNGTVTAFLKDGTAVGSLSYATEQGTKGGLIAMIEVADEHRRKGYASKLVEYVTDLLGGKPLNWGMTTPEGEALRRAVAR